MKRLMNNTGAKISSYTILLMFILAAISGAFIIFTLEEVSAGDGDFVDWNYYKHCNIANAANNYQIRLNVSKTSGGDVNCDGNCQDDFGDIRFADMDDNSALEYWMEENTSSTGNYAIFWIRLPSDAADDDRIHLWYNTSGTSTTTSDGEGTFANYLFDDFNDESFNTSMWSEMTGFANGDYSEIDGYLDVDGDSSSNYVIHSDTGFSECRLFARFKAINIADNWRIIGLVDVSDNAPGNSLYRTDVARVISTETNFTSNAGDDSDFDSQDYEGIALDTDWHVAQINRSCTSGSEGWFDFTSNITHTYYKNEDREVTFIDRGAAGDTGWNIDWVFVANYTSPAPTWSDFGSQQTAEVTDFGILYQTLDDQYVKLEGDSGATVYSNETTGAGQNLTFYLNIAAPDNCTDVFIDLSGDTALGPSDEIDFDSSSGNSDMFLQVSLDDDWENNWTQFTDANGYNISLNDEWENISNDNNPFPVDESSGNTTFVCIFRIDLGPGIDPGSYYTETNSICKVVYEIEE